MEILDFKKAYYNDVLMTGRVTNTPNNKLMRTPSSTTQNSISKELFPNDTVAVVSVSNSAKLLKRKLSSDDDGIDIIYLSIVFDY